MKKLTFALILAVAIAGGTATFSTFYDPPAKADSRAGIDPLQIMNSTKNLPVARYDDYSVGFN